MSDQILQQLADAELPACPEQLGRRVHRRLNDWLVWGQVVDLVLRGIPFTVFHFGKAVVWWGLMTLSGSLDVDRGKLEDC
jgi:hypothetical protein